MTGKQINSPAKITQPETLGQVKHHDQLSLDYRRAGLCVACAAQAGYGHQLGFTHIHQPCSPCAPVVAAFPIPKANGWRAIATRSWSGKRADTATAEPSLIAAA